VVLAYQGQWTNWFDFLGGGRRKEGWRSYEEAKKWAIASGIKGQKDWYRKSRAGELPDDLPAQPDKVYAGKGWTTWFDFVGGKCRRTSGWRSYEEAKKWAIANGIMKAKEWQQKSAAGELPDDLPAQPHLTYRGQWESWFDFLGRGRRNGGWRSYEEAKKWARENKVTGSEDWKRMAKAGEIPNDIPASVEVVYKSKGWTTWFDFLGQGRRNGGWRSYEEAKKWAKANKITCGKDWILRSSEGKLPDDLPGDPSRVYAEKGWTTWFDFLGHGHRMSGWRTYDKAEAWARANGVKSSVDWHRIKKAGQAPADMPSNIAAVYRGKGWVNWYRFCGRVKRS
jgi:hypothetical protein